MTALKVRLNYGFRKQDVDVTTRVGTCGFCAMGRQNLFCFEIPEAGQSELCEFCLADDPDAELVKVEEPTEVAEPEAEEVQNIEESHCQACGNTDLPWEALRVNDGYTPCCNELVIDHSITYPNGTNLPGVMSTCKSEGRCYHE